MEDIGKKIRVRRAELNMSQQDIADKVGTTKQTISKYESGSVKNPDYRMIKDIFVVLGLDTQQLNKHLSNIKDHRTTEPTPPQSRPAEIETLREEIRQLRQIVDALTVKLIGKL